MLYAFERDVPNSACVCCELLLTFIVITETCVCRSISVRQIVGGQLKKRGRTRVFWLHYHEMLERKRHLECRLGVLKCARLLVVYLSLELTSMTLRQWGHFLRATYWSLVFVQVDDDRHYTIPIVVNGIYGENLSAWISTSKRLLQRYQFCVPFSFQYPLPFRLLRKNANPQAKTGNTVLPRPEIKNYDGCPQTRAEEE